MKSFLPSYQIEKCIPKKDLVDGAEYEGHCRNSDVATWSAINNKFLYKRTKFGTSFIDEIDHLEDDRGFDCFVPWRRIL